MSFSLSDLDPTQITRGIGDAVSSGAQSIGSGLNQFAKNIGGYYGFDSDGKWTNSGGIFHWLDEGLGEVTGRNQSRAALNLSRDQFNYAQQQASDLVANQQWQRQQGDMAASSAAGAARATAAYSSTNTPSMSMTTPLGFGSGAQKDFLGL
jgi:hypothetical protein